jgi:hypothetical protein
MEAFEEQNYLGKEARSLSKASFHILKCKHGISFLG